MSSVNMGRIISSGVPTNSMTRFATMGDKAPNYFILPNEDTLPQAVFNLLDEMRDYPHMPDEEIIQKSKSTGYIYHHALAKYLIGRKKRFHTQ